VTASASPRRVRLVSLLTWFYIVINVALCCTIGSGKTLAFVLPLVKWILTLPRLEREADIDQGPCVLRCFIY
jgi:hypothetical protein